MILDLDVGNSRVKWRLSASHGPKGSMSYASIGGIEEKTFRPHDGSISRIRVSSVRSANCRSTLDTWAKAVYGVSPEYAVSAARVGKVCNGYDNPETLGVDRWLALLAAFELAGAAVCVIDYGSAITADLLDSSGMHLGGFISPGLDLMRASLLSGTDLVRFPPSVEGGIFCPGTRTASAVESGILASAAGFGNMCWQSFRSSVGPITSFVTGGDAEKILPLLNFPAALQPTLVLDGLALALP